MRSPDQAPAPPSGKTRRVALRLPDLPMRSRIRHLRRHPGNPSGGASLTRPTNA
ncbi:TPA: hypothetical protein I8287_003686, partial [Kluyvera intermedia]|nr:hypothetical protein [Kluyvera intermedia]